MATRQPLSAHPEHVAARPEAGDAGIPQDIWIVIILSVILSVLLIWKMIDEIGRGPGDGNGKNSRPPF